MEEKPTIIIIGGGSHLTDSLRLSLMLSKVSSARVLMTEPARHFDFKMAEPSEPILLEPWDMEAELIGGRYKPQTTDAFDPDDIFKTLENLAKLIEPVERELKILQLPREIKFKDKFPPPDKIPVPKAYRRGRHKNF